MSLTVIIITLLIVALCITALVVLFLKRRRDEKVNRIEMLYLLLKEVSSVGEFLDTNEFDAEKQMFSRALKALRQIKEYGVKKSSLSNEDRLALSKVCTFKDEIGLMLSIYYIETIMYKLYEENMENPHNPFKQFKITTHAHIKSECGAEDRETKNNRFMALASVNTEQLESAANAKLLFTVSPLCHLKPCDECNKEGCTSDLVEKKIMLDGYALVDLSTYEEDGRKKEYTINSSFVPEDYDGKAIGNGPYKIVTTASNFMFPFGSSKPKVVRPDSDGNYKFKFSRGKNIFIVIQRSLLNNALPAM
ncbi:hypothetical protein ENBRE01_0100 [Enteropsectra breve]|nr:hypothetical protein ENBRE01_0100 [Enteropsectra breve]